MSHHSDQVAGTNSSLVEAPRSGPFRFPLPWWQGMVLALILTVATLLLRLALEQQLQGQYSLIVFTVPIVVSAFFGGLTAGLAATALTFLLTTYYLLPPIHSFAVASASERWQPAFVLGTGAVVTGLVEGLHRARRDAAESTQQRLQAETALIEGGERQRQRLQGRPQLNPA